MANYSFDIVSELDKAELNNVFEQVKRDIANRYDFKNTPAAIEWLSEDKNGVRVTGNGDYQIEAIIELMRLALSKRGQSQKLLDLAQAEVNANFKVTKEIPFKAGVDQATAKSLSKLIRDRLPKLKSQIQGSSLRVSGPSKDELQKAIVLIRSEPVDLPIQFINFR